MARLSSAVAWSAVRLVCAFRWFSAQCLVSFILVLLCCCNFMDLHLYLQWYLCIVVVGCALAYTVVLSFDLF